MKLPPLPTAILTAALLSSPALAADTTPPPNWLQTHLDFSVDYAFRSNLDGAGSVSVLRANGDVDTAWQLCSKVVGTLYAGTEWTWYDFSGATGYLPGPPGTDKPFDVMQDTSIRPGFIYNFYDNWSLVGGGIFEYSGEPGATNAFRYGGYAGIRWQESKEFAITLGVLGESRFEDSFQFLPLIGLEWAVSDTVNVSLRGPSARVSTKLNDEWTFILDGAWQSREYRVDDDTYGFPNGVVRDVRVPVAAGFIWKPSGVKELEVTVKAGAIVYQEYELLDNTGARLSKFNTDMTPFVYAGFTWHF